MIDTQDRNPVKPRNRKGKDSYADSSFAVKQSIEKLYFTYNWNFKKDMVTIKVAMTKGNCKHLTTVTTSSIYITY